MRTNSTTYPRHRYPIAVVSQVVWLYYRFSLSFRDVSDLMYERGVSLSHETVRKWCEKFGGLYSERLRKVRRKPSHRWHIDEVHAKIAGKKCYIWRAVDEYGVVIDIYVSKRRNKKAARDFFTKALASEPKSNPTKVTSDRLSSYKSVVKDLAPKAKHIRGKWLNNRVENSHIPVRTRERKMKKFKSHKHAQSFLDRFELIYGFMKPKRHLMSANSYRRSLDYRLKLWKNCALNLIPI